jgi:hypothetical protein
MLVFYTLNVYSTNDTFRVITVASGAVQAVSIFLFFYNMLMTLLAKTEQSH